MELVRFPDPGFEQEACCGVRLGTLLFWVILSWLCGERDGEVSTKLPLTELAEPKSSSNTTPFS